MSFLLRTVLAAVLLSQCVLGNAYGSNPVSTRELQTVRNCKSLGLVIPECANPGNRDIVFLVDASESLDSGRFYAEFLDFLESAWCGFADTGINRGGMITFGRKVVTRIPFAQYTSAQWFAEVAKVRVDSSVCCSCCTPTAEAFAAAQKMLLDSPASDDTTRLVMVISDGDPWQNMKGSKWRFPKVGPATYTYKIVPRQARLLRNLGGRQDAVRLMFLGVPNRHGKPPEVGFFRGSAVLGKRRCISRKRKKECVRIGKNSQLYPLTSTPVEKYISISNTWNVQQLIELVHDDLCRPTGEDEEMNPFNSLDLYVFLDNSKSMRWRAPNCRAAPGANLSANDLQVCWELFLKFTENLVHKATALVPPGNTIPIGWQADFPDKTKGLRLFIYGFACADGQTTPLVKRIGEKIATPQEFQAAMEAAKSLIPNGGTCPGASFERALGQIMANEPLKRPYKAALLFTDGVFYDQPIPEVASKGFAHFGVLTYALGISIPDTGNNQGLTPAEIADQKKQLLAFVNNNSTRLLNFGSEGYNLLDQIATSFISKLPADVAANYPFVIKKPYFCGFSNNERCLNRNTDTFVSAKYCKWIPDNWNRFEGNGRCMDKDWCGWSTSATCNKDSWCKWTNGKCQYIGKDLSTLK